MAEQWQPIETAPKDGSEVLLRGKGARAAIANGYWLKTAYNGNGAWIWPIVSREPAHWTPLPAAPGASPEPHPEDVEGNLLVDVRRKAARYDWLRENGWALTHAIERGQTPSAIFIGGKPQQTRKWDVIDASIDAAIAAANRDAS